MGRQSICNGTRKCDFDTLWDGKFVAVRSAQKTVRYLKCLFLRQTLLIELLWDGDNVVPFVCFIRICEPPTSTCLVHALPELRKLRKASYWAVVDAVDTKCAGAELRTDA